MGSRISGAGLGNLLRGGLVYDVRRYGARGDGAADDTAAIQAAIDAADAAGGGVVYLPRGTYRTTAPLNLPSGVSAHGAGRFSSYVDFHPTAPGQAALLGSGVSDVEIRGLRVRSNGARAVNRINTTLTHAGTYPVHFLNCEDCSVIDCNIEWGSWGVFLDNTSDAWTSANWTTNRGHIVRGCRFTEQATEGLYIRHGSDITVGGCVFEGAGTDGIKTDRRSRALTITGNVSRGHGGDGYDFYDGLLESTVSGNVADDCSAYGFEFKGTLGGFDGTATDYVCRDSSITGNVGSRCLNDGYNIASVRNLSFSANQAISCGGDGFSITGAQDCSFSSDLAGKNAAHGFNLATSSRLTFSACSAVDNSWTDGTAQTGTYHGWNLDASSYATMMGCRALNSSTAGRRGGQGYGASFAGPGSNVIGGQLSGVTGFVNGLAGNYVTGSAAGAVGAYQEAGGGVVLGPRLVTPFVTLADSTAPSVAAGNAFVTASSSAKNIFNFAGGSEGQRIIVWAGEANTGWNHNASLQTRGGVAIAAGAWTWIEFILRGAVWYELDHK